MQQYSDGQRWDRLTTRRRCAIVGSVAAGITAASEQLIQLCRSDQRTDPVETIAGELMPLCGSLRFIARSGPKILRTKKLGAIGRPAWMWGVRSVVRRDPHGTVLILGTWNYPLLLVGAQAAQALAGGNRVLVKPAIGSEAVTERMLTAFYEAGVPKSQLQQIDSSTESAVSAIDSGVDLIVLTGAASTGRKVLARAAQSLTPTIMELSGCDAVVLMPGVDIERIAGAVDFALNFNGGATCIGPRRLIVEDAQADRLGEVLGARMRSSPMVTVHEAARESVANTVQQALEQGAVDRTEAFDAAALRRDGRMLPLVLDRVVPDNVIASADLFAPVTSIMRVDQISDAAAIVNDCPYRLASSVFGPADQAIEMANQLKTGSVAINDLVVPTADPRLPFGGRGDSGFGVTRGAEGLLAMTVPTVISRRRGRFAPHLQPRLAASEQALLGAQQLLYAGSFNERLRGLRELIAGLRNKKTEEES